MAAPIVDEVGAAIIEALRASDPGAWIEFVAPKNTLLAIDGKFEIEEIAKAAIAAVKANLSGRIAHDEEGINAMLDGGKGPLE